MANKLTSQSPGLTGGIGGGGLGGSGGYGGKLIETGQTTEYHVGDDGDFEIGLNKSYSVLTTGQFSGTTAIDTPHYANNGISFTAPSTIDDAGAGFITFLAADTIRVRGSALNDGVYTVAVGGVAGQIVVNEATIVNEAAGAYVTICKRTTPSNNAVIDNVTGIMWKRYTTGTIGSLEKVGPTSNGRVSWYDTATCYTLHPAAADLQMMTTGIKIVGGAGEIARYFAGMVIDPSGFANAVNNLPGYVVSSVAVNGADLDIFLWDCNNTLVAEAAAGARDIRVVCRSVFAYCAAANAASFAGYSDWRIPNIYSMFTITDYEAATAVPNATAFPSWPTAAYVWTSTTVVDTTANAMAHYFLTGATQSIVKTNTNHYCELVRG